MDSESPYRPPQSVDLPPPARSDEMPKTARIFGNLHRLFGYLGIGGAVFFILRSTNGNPENHLTIWRWTLFGLNTVVSGLMAYAGVRLSKEEPDGVKWSNLYAWSSIAVTVLNDLVLLFFPSSFNKVNNLVLSAVVLTYPVLALDFLRRPAVKAWVAAKSKPEA